MSNEILQSAVSKLSIVDIFLIDDKTTRKTGYIPPYVFDGTSIIGEQYKVQQISHIKERTTLSNEIKGDGIDGVIYSYKVGFRYVNKVDDEDWKIEYSATFGALYKITEKISEEELTVFGQINVGYNVWPYWRELAGSMILRLKIPGFIIPLYTLPKNKEEPL